MNELKTLKLEHEGDICAFIQGVLLEDEMKEAVFVLRCRLGLLVVFQAIVLTATLPLIL